MKIKKLKIIFLGLTLVLVAVTYNSNYIMFKAINAVDFRTGSLLQLGKIRNSVMKLVDDINPLKGTVWRDVNGIPVINFEMSKKQLSQIAVTVEAAKLMSPYDLYMPNEVNEFLSTNISIDGERYKAKIKLHGTNNPHFIHRKKSYSIKISSSKNDSFPFNTRRFALIIPSQSNLIGMYTYKIAEMVGLVSPQNFLVRLYINGIDQGVYHLEEKLSKSLLERNNMSGYDVVRSDDSWAHQYANNHGTMFSFDYSGLQDKAISGKSLNQLVLIKEVLNSTDISFIRNHVDVEAFILYDILRYVFGDSAHMTSNDNIKLLYDTSTGRLKPYFRIENHIVQILPNRLSYSPEQHVNFGKYTVNNLLFQLTKDDDYRERRNREIYKFLQKKEDYLVLFDQLVSANLSFLTNDTSNEVPSRYFEYQIEEARKNLVYNFEFLEKYLDYSRIFIELIRKDKISHEILVKPDSNAPLASSHFKVYVESDYIKTEVKVRNLQSKEIHNLIVEEDGGGRGVIDLMPVLEGLTFSLSLDENLEPVKNSYAFSIQFEGKILGSAFEFYNDLNQQKVLSRDAYSVIVDESAVVARSLPAFLKKVKADLYQIPSGSSIVLEKNVVLPHGISVEINDGVTIELKQGVSFLVNGGLSINGSQTRPVRISNHEYGYAFGSIGVLGDGKSLVDIRFLEIYGGSEDFINGVHLSGALSVHNHKYVVIRNSDIHHNAADDGVNIKNASLLVKDNRFYANKADQIDIDFGLGEVIGNHFAQGSLIPNFAEVKISEDANGDGLDFSGSQVVVDGNIFNGFLDKGMSIGENTKAFITNNRLESNASGITAKDESEVYLLDNYYENNNIDIEMYQKKKIFDFPSVYSLSQNPSQLIIKKTKESSYFKLDGIFPAQDTAFDTSVFNSLKNLSWIEYE